MLTSVNDSDNYIRMTYVGHPDVFAVEAVRVFYAYKCRLTFLETVRIWEARHVYPDGGDPDGNTCFMSPWGAWHVFSGGGSLHPRHFIKKQAPINFLHHLTTWFIQWTTCILLSNYMCCQFSQIIFLFIVLLLSTHSMVFPFSHLNQSLKTTLPLKVYTKLFFFGFSSSIVSRNFI